MKLVNTVHNLPLVFSLLLLSFSFLSRFFFVNAKGEEVRKKKTGSGHLSASENKQRKKQKKSDDKQGTTATQHDRRDGDKGGK